MSSGPSESQSVIEVLLAVIDSVGAEEALLVGEASRSLAPRLEERGVATAVSMAMAPAGRTWQVVVVLALGNFDDGVSLLRGLQPALSDESVVLVSAANLGHRGVTTSLLEGTWGDTAQVAGRLFTIDSLRGELESAGFVVEAMQPVGDGIGGDGDDTMAFVARGVPHRAAAQVASARRRVAEVVAERDQRDTQIADLRRAQAREAEQRAALEADVAALRRDVRERDVALDDLAAQVEVAQTRARKRRRQRDRALAQRDALQEKVSALQRRRVVRLANKVGRMTGRAR